MIGINRSRPIRNSNVDQNLSGLHVNEMDNEVHENTPGMLF